MHDPHDSVRDTDEPHEPQESADPRRCASRSTRFDPRLTASSCSSGAFALGAED